MSSRFAYRVKLMERRITAPGACKECGGLLVVKCIVEGEPMPEPCPGCGRERSVIVFVKATPPEGWVQRTMPDYLLD